MPPTLTLPRLDGTLAPYTLSGRAPITAPPGPIASRIGMAAVHVVADPLANVNPTLDVALDWDATLRFRHHVWSLGLAVAEAADTARRREPLRAVVGECAAKMDGVKFWLLDQKREITMRTRSPAGVRMYTGDDFDSPTTIRGDGTRHSDALLGIFDVIAPAASAALKALDRGDLDTYEKVLAPTLTLSRHVFGDPTRFYKTGVVFAAYVNGHQSHFRMVGGLESARSVVHLSEQFRLMDAAGLLADPERAAARLRRVLAVAGIE